MAKETSTGQITYDPSQPVNYNTMPEAIQHLIYEFREIKEALADGSKLRIDINDQDRVYSLRELADRWSVSQSTIIRMMRSGDLKYSKLRRQYRITHRDAMECLEQSGRASWPSYKNAVREMKK